MKSATHVIRVKISQLALVALVIGLMLFAGCTDTQAPTATEPSPPPAPTAVDGTAVPSQTGVGESLVIEPAIGALATLAEIAPTRTALPSPTPDLLVAAVTELVQGTGLAGGRLLWLDYADWINLGISLFLVAVGYLVGAWLVYWLLPRLFQRTRTQLGTRLLHVVGNQLRWLVVLLVLRFATNRLTFINAKARGALLDLYFFLALFLVIGILWRLINLAAQLAEDHAKRLGYWERGRSLIDLSVWVMRFGVFLLALTLILSHFAINITGIAVFIGIVGLTISVASRDILADIIAGVMILIDRPYRIGDRIELLDLNTTGNVYEIGMRTTRILTVNNRMVVVPNSQMASNKVVNYSYPDPSMYDASDVLVAYENDVEQMRQLLVETLRSVEGVQTERTMDALLMELTETHIRFRIGWWISSYTDLFIVRDRVNRAVLRALSHTSIALPYRKGSLQVEILADQAATMQQARRGNA